MTLKVILKYVLSWISNSVLVWELQSFCYYMFCKNRKSTIKYLRVLMPPSHASLNSLCTIVVSASCRLEISLHRSSVLVIKLIAVCTAYLLNTRAILCKCQDCAWWLYQNDNQLPAAVSENGVTVDKGEQCSRGCAKPADRNHRDDVIK